MEGRSKEKTWEAPEERASDDKRERGGMRRLDKPERLHPLRDGAAHMPPLDYAFAFASSTPVMPFPPKRASQHCFVTMRAGETGQSTRHKAGLGWSNSFSLTLAILQSRKRKECETKTDRRDMREGMKTRDRRGGNVDKEM